MGLGPQACWLEGLRTKFASLVMCLSSMLSLVTDLDSACNLHFDGVLVFTKHMQEAKYYSESFAVTAEAEMQVSSVDERMLEFLLQPHNCIVSADAYLTKEK